MAPAATTTFFLGVLAVLLLLPELLWASSADRHTLSCELTIKPTAPHGEPWCSVQGKIDQNTSFSWDCVNDTVKLMNVVEEKVNSTGPWKGITETLKDVADMFKDRVLDLKPENCATTAPLTLRVTIACERDTSRHTNSSLKMDINGKISVHIDPKHKIWTENPSGLSCMKDNWENDKEITNSLYTTSEGDCGYWLKLMNVKRLERIAPPPTTIDSTHSSSMSVAPSLWVLLLVLTCCI